MKIKSILFDFDFTLADSSKGVYECVNYAFNLENQLIENIWIFKEYADSKLIKTTELPLKMRYIFRQEMIYLFELTGFEIIDLYGNYKKEKPEYGSNLIWIAKKK